MRKRHFNGCLQIEKITSQPSYQSISCYFVQHKMKAPPSTLARDGAEHLEYSSV